jgi:hypothetical protein
MKLETGIHPGRWFLGVWIAPALFLVLALVLWCGPTGGATAWAAPGPGTPQPDAGGNPTPNGAPPLEQQEENPAPRPSAAAMFTAGSTYVSEVLDSLFFVQPAGFLALDLPHDPAGARAVHLTGTVSVRGRNRDIMVRLFRSKDYDAWLHPGGGTKGEPLWTSKRARSHQLDFALPEGGPFVLLLDNGYSIRTPKHVSCQLQIQYQVFGTVPLVGRTSVADTSGTGAESVFDESNPVTPRGNGDEQPPPPPPPPPSGY